MIWPIDRSSWAPSSKQARRTITGPGAMSWIDTRLEEVSHTYIEDGKVTALFRRRFAKGLFADHDGSGKGAAQVPADDRDEDGAQPAARLFAAFARDHDL